ncbi:Bis-tetraphosphatase [Trichophyton interdigitale]|uniref:Bis-tetraphosphatase n=1 Tax=Trichophyton interdigitale TaxID=101480 RepID=A0A9P5CZL1_9EURO|nr:Bis-tetraphosphatase [Trichophyton interdigitale]KAF3900610.1 Bis-tetraphosphatase [Trichophyton interdigitale]KAG8211558.1 Bis-tetraphosphatase [Trichophyton interdigitale]
MNTKGEAQDDTMLLGLSEHLALLVARRFIAAKNAGSLVFSQTEVTSLQSSTVPFQLRYCPALAVKPTNSSPQQPASTTASDPAKPKKVDPFENPHTDLLVAQIPASDPTHILVLNKFPVIPNHFILATKAFKPQTHLLEADDLHAAFACLKEWEKPAGELPGDENVQAAKRQKRLFAFFNSGEHSGASQPHRHLQFLPVEDMHQADDVANWQPLIDSEGHAEEKDNSEQLQQPKLPFVTYTAPLSPNPTPEELHRSYLSLYAMAVTAAAQHSESLLNGISASRALGTEGEAAISYNLAMTTSKMMICPRRSEHAWITLEPEAKKGLVDEGLVKLNGTILAGTLMVKAEAEWNTLRQQPSMLENVLSTVGIPT